MRALKRVPKALGKRTMSLKERTDRIAEALVNNLNRNVLKDAALREKK